MAVSASVIIGVEIALILLSYALVAARLLFSRRKANRHLVVSNIWLAVSGLVLTGLEVCNIALFRMGALESPNEEDAPMYSSPSVAKIRFSSSILYDVGMYLPKLSIIFFYHFLAIDGSRITKRALNVFAILLALAAICTFMVDLFGCGQDTAMNWSPDLKVCSAVHSTQVLEINWALNIATDVCIFILAFPILRGQSFPSFREKLGLATAFAFGITTMFVSVVHFVGLTVNLDFMVIYRWSAAELALALITASLPSLRPYHTNGESGHSTPSPKDVDEAESGPSAPRDEMKRPIHIIHEISLTPSTSPSVASDEERDATIEWTDIELDYEDDVLEEEMAAERHGHHHPEHHGHHIQKGRSSMHDTYQEKFGKVI